MQSCLSCSCLARPRLLAQQPARDQKRQNTILESFSHRCSTVVLTNQLASKINKAQDMMIIPSVDVHLFNSKVDLAPPLEEQKEVPTRGAVEKSRVRLGMEKKIFSRTGDFVPIVTALDGTPYLQAKSSGSKIVVLGADTAGRPSLSPSWSELTLHSRFTPLALPVKCLLPKSHRTKRF